MLSSKTLKSLLLSPLIRVPFLSTTTTSTFTTSTSTEMGFPLMESFGGGGTSAGGSGIFAPASLRGPCARTIAPASISTSATRVIRSRMDVISGFSLSEGAFTAQDFDLLLPPLINADLHHRQLAR